MAAGEQQPPSSGHSKTTSSQLAEYSPPHAGFRAWASRPGSFFLFDDDDNDNDDAAYDGWIDW